MTTEQAFNIVLNLAEQNVLEEIPKDHENNEERKRQLEALNRVRKVQRRLFALKTIMS